MNRSVYAALFVFLMFVPLSASAQTIETVSNVLTPTTSNDRFGQAIAVDGDLMAVGVPGEPNGGAVYIRGRDVGGPNVWGVIKRVEGTSTAEFGWAVALQGDTLIVGAPDEGNTLIDNWGATYIFERDEGGADNWGQVKKFTAPIRKNRQEFGYSVALDGDTLVVGAPRHHANNGDLFVGTAFVFERDQGGADNWGFTQQLESYAGDSDRFGYEVAISGDLIVASAPYGGPSNVYGVSGAVKFYERNQGGPGNWGYLKTKSASNWTLDNRFGLRIDLDGDRLAVGAPRQSVSGTVYILERNAGGPDNWGESRIITASDGDTDDYFGRDVFLDGDRLYVGATYDDDFAQNSGSVYVFDQNLGGPDNWGLEKKFQAFDRAAEDWFGYSIAVDGTTVAIGARNRNAADGAVYVTGPAPNPAPVADDQDLMTDEDTPLNITLTATDTEPVTFMIVTQPMHGTLTGTGTGTGSNLTYTPNADFNGVDSFEFVADDNTTVSQIATVQITVASVNDAPVAYDASRTTVEGTPISITLSGSDVESDPLTFRVVQPPSSGSIDGTAPNLTYTPDPSFVGQDEFTFVVNDGELDSNPATVTLQVNADNPNNRAPIAQPQTIAVVTGVASMITLSGNDPDGDVIDFEIASPPANGTLTGTPPTLTYTSDAGFEGTDTLTFFVSDGALDSAPAVVTIEVSTEPGGPGGNNDNGGENSPPEFEEPAADAIFEAEVGQLFELLAVATDADDDPITYDATGLPPGASFDTATGRLTWTPETAGSYGLILTASDGIASTTRAVTLQAVDSNSIPSGTSGSPDEGCCSTSRGTPSPVPLALLISVAGLFFLRRRASVR